MYTLKCTWEVTPPHMNEAHTYFIVCELLSIWEGVNPCVHGYVHVALPDIAYVAPYEWSQVWILWIFIYLFVCLFFFNQVHKYFQKSSYISFFNLPNLRFLKIWNYFSMWILCNYAICNLFQFNVFDNNNLWKMSFE